MKNEGIGLQTLTHEELRKLLRKNSAKLKRLKKKLDIEAELEKIRSRAMMMKDSAEFTGLAGLFFQSLLSPELLSIGARTYFSLLNTTKKSAEVWMTHADGKLMPESWQMLPDQPGSLDEYYKSWKQKEPLIIRQYSGQALKEFLQCLSTFPFLMKDTGYRILTHYSSEEIWMTEVPFLQGTIGIISFEALTKEATQKVGRYARVFELIYTRFLDLQKAEAQSREALIEAAFRRVRAKTMAMHKSEQLAETAKVLFEQFGLLGKIPDRMSIGVINEESRRVELWVTDQLGNRLNHEYYFSIDEPTSMAKIYTAWKEGKDAIIIDLTGQDLQDWVRFVKEKAKLPLDETKIKGRRVHQAAFFSQGFLLFTTHEPVAEEIMRLLVRFARVFDLTYTRFRDLLKAEAQALDAIRASSLDRVRAEIASMRTTGDLQRITPLVWHELTVLGVPFIRCGVFIMDEVKENVQVYVSAPDGQTLAIMNLPFHSSELIINSVDHWLTRMVYREHWNKDRFLNWAQAMIDRGQIQSREAFLGTAKVPELLDLHFVPFKQGMLYVGNASPLSSSEIDLIKSLAEAFSIAYARYEDFGRLEQAKQNIEMTLTELQATQVRLIQSEKMAFLGELTAGIAHEIQNPLNFVNNFSDVNKELIAEMKQAIHTRNDDETLFIIDSIEANEEKINYHGKRADAIVKSMLQHSQTSAGKEESTDVNALADEYLRLSYHGIRAKDKHFNAVLKTDFDNTIGNINVIPKDIGRVLLNLYNNAFYALSEKNKTGHDRYEATISVATRKVDSKIEIRVKDNGQGISQKILDKIFQPFFTTKPTGQGTGLGLSLSYDIVKAHGGELKVESVEGDSTEFVIQIPDG